MQILVASNVAPVRHTLRHLLEREGHKVLLAESLELALDAVTKHSQIDVIICEWKLGEGKAVLLQRRCQEVDRVTDDGVKAMAPHFIVLAMPNAATRVGETSPVRNEIQSFGFQDVLEKPVNRQVLIQRIRSIAQERQRPMAVMPARGDRVTTVESVPKENTESAPPDPACPFEQINDLQGQVVALRQHFELETRRLSDLAQSLHDMLRAQIADVPDTNPLEDLAHHGQNRPVAGAETCCTT